MIREQGQSIGTVEILRRQWGSIWTDFNRISVRNNGPVIEAFIDRLTSDTRLRMSLKEATELRAALDGMVEHRERHWATVRIENVPTAWEHGRLPAEFSFGWDHEGAEIDMTLNADGRRWHTFMSLDEAERLSSAVGRAIEDAERWSRARP